MANCLKYESNEGKRQSGESGEGGKSGENKTTKQNNAKY